MFGELTPHLLSDKKMIWMEGEQPQPLMGSYER